MTNESESNTSGKMVEWFKAAVLKTAGAQAPEGSNPSLSAIFFALISRQKNMKPEKALLHTASAVLHILRHAAKCFIRRQACFIKMKPFQMKQLRYEAFSASLQK